MNIIEEVIGNLGNRDVIDIQFISFQKQKEVKGPSNCFNLMVNDMCGAKVGIILEAE